MSNAQKPSSKFFYGLAVIIVGFACLRTPPVDSFWSMTVAPLLLVLGYLVLIPLGLWPRRLGPPVTDTEAGVDSNASVIRLTGLGVFLVSLITYCLTLWPGPRWWDSAGYMASSITMGVDGAPGSLLLQLLGRLSWFATPTRPAGSSPGSISAPAAPLGRARSAGRPVLLGGMGRRRVWRTHPELRRLHRGRTPKVRRWTICRGAGDVRWCC